MLRAVAGVGEGDDLPAAHVEVLEEGRTTAAVSRVLHRRLQPGANVDEPVRIYVSTDMVKDWKELNLAHDGEAEFDDCHRGVSPFAVPHTSVAAQRRRRKEAEALKDATNVTAEELRKARETKVEAPKDYYGLLRVLANYEKFLVELAGENCRHRTEVEEILRILRRWVSVFENIREEKIIQLLWAIFDDARQFFRACQNWNGGDLPTSTLRYVTAFLQAGKIIDHEHCPVLRFLPAQRETGQRRRGGSGGTLAATPEDDEFPEATPTRPVTRKVHAAFREVMGDLKADFPRTSVTHLMNAVKKPLTYDDVRVGRPGTCLDLNILGKCTTNCGYRHGETNVTDDRAQEVADKLRPAVAAYKARGGRKRKRGPGS